MRKQLKKEREKESTVFLGLKSPPAADCIAFLSLLPQRDCVPACRKRPFPTESTRSHCELDGVSWWTENKEAAGPMKMTVVLRHLLITAACAWELKRVTRETRTQIPPAAWGKFCYFLWKTPNVSGSWIRIVPRGYYKMNFDISERWLVKVT